MARVQVPGISGPAPSAPGGAMVQLSGGPLKAPESTTADRLINSLKSVAGIYKDVKDSRNEEDEREADEFFRSRTLGDIDKLIRAGELPADRSPVFRARVENLYGENYANQLARDVEKRLIEGDESVKDPEAAEQFITNARNQFLAGQSQFTTAGFDKTFLALRNRTQEIVSKANTAAAVEHATGAMTENLYNVFDAGSSIDKWGLKVPGEQAAQGAVQAYLADSKMLALPPKQRKAALSGLVQRLVEEGHHDAVQQLLSTQLSDGQDVRTVLGPVPSRVALSMSKEAYNKVMREKTTELTDRFTILAENGELDSVRGEFEEARAKFDPWGNFGTIQRLNAQVVAASLRDAAKLDAKIQTENQIAGWNNEAQASVAGFHRTGNVQQVRPQQYINENGAIKTWDAEAALTSAILTSTQGNFPRRVEAFAAYDIVDEESQQMLQQAAAGFSLSYFKGEGKGAGEPPAHVVQGIERFREVNALNPAYARSLLSEKEYWKMQGVASLIRGGRSVRDAVETVNRAEGSFLTSSDTQRKQVTTAVAGALEAITDPSYFRTAWRKMFGDASEQQIAAWGGAGTNIAPIRAELRKQAEIEMLAGAPSGEIAAERVLKQHLKTGSMVIANGALYWRADLPSTFPQGMDPQQGMETFHRMVGTWARNAKLQLDDDEITLLPDGRGGFSVTHTETGAPIVVDGRSTWSKADMLHSLQKYQDAANLRAVEGAIRDRKEAIRDRKADPRTQRSATPQRERQQPGPRLPSIPRSRNIPMQGGPGSGNRVLGRTLNLTPQGE